MSREQNFLVTYGLHNFVTHALKRGRHAFFIQSRESRMMISHAKTLIEESFGETADIRMA